MTDHEPTTLLETIRAFTRPAGTRQLDGPKRRIETQVVGLPKLKDLRSYVAATGKVDCYCASERAADKRNLVKRYRCLPLQVCNSCTAER